MSRTPLISRAALRVLAVTAVSFFLLSACGKAEEAAEDAAAEAATEAAIEAVTDADIDVSDGGQTVSGVDEEGRAFSVTQGEAATLPAGFPADAYLPEGLVLDTAMVVGENIVVGGSLPGSVATLAAEVETRMAAAGWTSMLTMTEPGSSAQRWEQGGRGVTYMIEEQGEGRLGLVITVGVEGEGSAGEEAAE